MNASHTVARRALVTILMSATLGWILFTAGLILDVYTRSGKTFDELYGDDAVGMILPSKYLTLLAITVFAIGALIAKRQLVKQGGTQLGYLGAVYTFANVALVVALAMTAIGGVSVFMSGFFDGSQAAVSIRLLDVYVPIICYTIVLVSVLLAGFVFVKHSAQNGGQPPVQVAAPAASTETVQRATALSFAVPIIAVAIALIIGLIVYDITKHSPEVWIWVIIQTLIAAGIIIGTFLARNAMRGSGTVDQHTGLIASPSGVSVGAQTLNFILSVIFTVAVSIMALTYAASAANALQVNTYLSLNVWDTDSGMLEQLPAGNPVKNLTLQADGNDLERTSPATVMVTPGGEVLLEDEVDRHGYLYMETEFVPDVDPGEYALVFEAVDSQSVTQTLELPFTVLESGNVQFADGSYIASDMETPQMRPMSLQWFFENLLPAFLLWLITMALIFLTLNLRNAASTRSVAGATP